MHTLKNDIVTPTNFVRRSTEETTIVLYIIQKYVLKELITKTKLTYIVLDAIKFN